MKCGNVCACQQNALTLKAVNFLADAGIPDNGIDLRIECRLDTLAHFKSGGLCKSKNQNTIQGQLLIPHLRNNAFHQYARLPGTCRRRHENIVSSRINRALLVCCECQPIRHRDPPPLRSVQFLPSPPAHYRRYRGIRPPV